MSKRKNLVIKLLLASAAAFTLVSCGEGPAVTSVVFDEDYQAEWKVGEIDFSSLKFFVTYANGVIETVPVNSSMIEEKDLYKFYQPGECKVKINFNSKYYNVIDFVIYENEFGEDIKLVNQTIAYDGKSHSLAIDGALPEGTNVYYPFGNSFTNSSVEPYQIKCILSKEGYKTKELNGRMTITQSEYSKEILDQIVFEDAEFDYDGSEKRIVASNIPADCSIEYFIDKIKGNARTDAGIYTVVGKITCNNYNYLPIPDIKAVLTINKAKYDTSGLSFEDKIVEFQEGVQQYVEVSGLETLPNNVKVEYNNTNYGINVGTYHAVATFICDPNYEQIPEMKADLVITSATIDLQDVVIQKPQIKKYDGEIKDFEVEVPKVIEVEKTYIDSNGFEVEDPIDVGTYTVKLDYRVNSKLVSSNYNIINKPTENGLLIIEKKVLDLEKLNFDIMELEYDGEEHDFIVETETEEDGEVVKHRIPDELNIEKVYYLNGKQLENELPKNVGDYSVAFNITFKEGFDADNYSVINGPTKNGLLSITKIAINLKNVVVSDQIYEYSGTNQTYKIGVPEHVSCSIVYNKDGEIVDETKEIGKYNVFLTFSLIEDESQGITNENYGLINIPKTTASMTITKKQIDVDVVEADDIFVPFTGEEQGYGVNNLKNFDKVSAYVNPVFRYWFEGKELTGLPKEPGTYIVYISFVLKPEISPDYYKVVSKFEYFSVTMTIEEE